MTNAHLSHEHVFPEFVSPCYLCNYLFGEIPGVNACLDDIKTVFMANHNGGFLPAHSVQLFSHCSLFFCFIKLMSIPSVTSLGSVPALHEIKSKEGKHDHPPQFSGSLGLPRFSVPKQEQRRTQWMVDRFKSRDMGQKAGSTESNNSNIGMQGGADP